MDIYKKVTKTQADNRFQIPAPITTTEKDKIKNIVKNFVVYFKKKHL
jgi:hypothetical protein